MQYSIRSLDWRWSRLTAGSHYFPRVAVLL